MYFHGKKVGQFDLVNTKEIILPVCDKPYHKNKEKYRNGRRLKFCVTVHWASTMRLLSGQHGVDWRAKFATIF